MEMVNGKDKSNSNNTSLTIHIENFNNSTDKDIEQLAYELEFYRQRVAMGRVVLNVSFEFGRKIALMTMDCDREKAHYFFS